MTASLNTNTRKITGYTGEIVKEFEEGTSVQEMMEEFMDIIDECNIPDAINHTIYDFSGEPSLILDELLPYQMSGIKAKIFQILNSSDEANYNMACSDALSQHSLDLQNSLNDFWNGVNVQGEMRVTFNSSILINNSELTFS